MKKSVWAGLLILLTTLVVGFFYLHCLDTEIVGTFHDDGIYAILGKALASGQGFHLIHLPLSPPQTKYPILYPLILALGWWLNPRFPENLSILNGLTLAFSLAALPLVFYYFQLCKKAPIWLAWLLVLFTASAMLAYGTALMSEGPYLFFTLLTLFWAELRLLKVDANSEKIALGVCVLLSALVFHTRIIGITLILAVTIWLCLQKRFKAATSYIALCALITFLPWGLWTWGNQLPMDANHYALFRPYSNYAFVLSSLTQNPEHYWQTLISGIGSLMMALMGLFFPVLIDPSVVLPAFTPTQHPLISQAYFIALLAGSYGLLGYFIMALLTPIRKAWAEKSGTPFSISGLYIVLYCGVILLWNFESHLGRFLLVISPWLWFYLLKPFCLSAPAPKGRILLKTSLLILLSTLAFALTPWTYKTLYAARHGHFLSMHPQWSMLWQDYRSTFSFIQKQLPPQAPIGAFYETTAYLYTEHPTIFAFFPALRTQNGFPLPTAYSEFLASMKRHGIRYFLGEPQIIRGQGTEFPENPFVKQLLELEPQHFKKRYISPHGLIQLYERTEEATP